MSEDARTRSNRIEHEMWINWEEHGRFGPGEIVLLDSGSHGTRQAWLYQGCRCEKCDAAYADNFGEPMVVERKGYSLVGECPFRHGTWKSWHYGCRCDECMKINEIAHGTYWFSQGCRCPECCYTHWMRGGRPL